MFENLHHAEHTVHRRPDFVAHGGEEGGLGLRRQLRLDACGFRRFFRNGERGLAFAKLRDVVIDAEQTAVLEFPENVFDVTAAIRAPLVAVAAGLAHPCGDFGDLGVDVEIVERSIFAAGDGVTDQLQGGIAGSDLIRRIAMQLAVVAIAEHPAEILVEQRDAVAQIVEHRLHNLVGALDLVARRLRRLLRGRERLLAVLQLGDVARHRDGVTVRQRDEAEIEMLVRGAPFEIAAARLGDEVKSRAGEVLGLLDRAEIAAPGLVAQDVHQRQSRRNRFGRQLEEVGETLVGELQTIFGIEQRHAVAHVVQHRLHDAARLLDGCLAFLDLGDIPMHTKQAAAGERLVSELDVPAAHCFALVAHTAGRQHHGAALLDRMFDVVGRSEIAALGLIADNVLDRSTGGRHSARYFELFHELLVAEHEVEPGVEQDDAVVHVVEDGLHHRARALDILFGQGQGLLAVLELGNVAIDAKHAAVG